MSKKRSVLLLVVGICLGTLITAGLFSLLKNTPSSTSPEVLSETNVTPTSEEKTGTPREPLPSTLKYPNRNLKGNCTFSGTIFNYDGKPASGAVVRLRLLDEPWISANLPHQVETDETGTYEIGGLTSDADYQLFAWADTHQTVAHSNPVCGTKTDLYLSGGAALLLSFVDESGNPLKHVEMSISGSSLWPTRNALSDDTGVLDLFGLSPGFYTFSARSGDLAFTLMEPIELAQGDEVELEAQLAQTAPNFITVVDRLNQTPIEHARVTISPKNAPLLSRSYLTNSAGNVQVSGLSLEGNEVTVWAAGYIRPPGDSIYPGDNMKFALDKGMSVNGVVQTAQGSPIADARIDLHMESGTADGDSQSSIAYSFMQQKQRAEQNGWPQAVPVTQEVTLLGPSHIPLPQLSEDSNQSPMDQPWSPTNSKGDFTIDGLEPGHYRIGATHPEYVLQKRTSIHVVANEAPPFATVIMQKGVTASVKVITPQGIPIGQAEITAYDPDGNIRSTQMTDPEGTAVITGLPRQFQIQSTAEGYLPLAQVLVGRPGKTITHTMRMLPADKHIKGKVVNKIGTGIHGAYIRARSNSRNNPHLLSTITKGDGTFVLENTGAGTYHIEVLIDGTVRTQLTDANFEKENTLVVNIAKNGSAQLPLGQSEYPDGDYTIITPQTGDSLGIVAVTDRVHHSSSNPIPTTEPDTDSTYTSGSVNTTYGPADQLIVTGPPAGKGGLPITISGGPGNVVITSVQGGSQVAAAGLRHGDKLISVDGIKITGPASARKAIQGRIGSVVMLEVRQEGEPVSIVVQRVRVK